MAKLTALVIEDIGEWRRRLKEHLIEAFDINVRVFASFEAAEKRLASRTPYHIVVTDLYPKDSMVARGLDIAEFVSRVKSIPVIVVTGHENADNVRQSFKECNVINVLFKSKFSRLDFIKSVQEGLRNSDQPLAKNADVSGLIGKLKKLPKGGGKKARAYQELVYLIFCCVFDRQLTDIRLEDTMYDGRKRIDIVATNSARSGFFESLSSKSGINSKYIPIECKNYAHAIGNPEFDQIGGRLYKKFGMFGFLAYRSASNKKAILKRCQDHLDKDEHILALDDEELIALLGMRGQENFADIEKLLENKFRALVAKKHKE